MFTILLKKRYDTWIYPLYIIIACAFTAGLNIVHTKYILNIEQTAPSFIVPTIAGIIFGYLTARMRLSTYKVDNNGEFFLYVKYILLSCFVTSALNVVHTEWVLGQALTADLFVAPILAGIFFGYLLARINSLNNDLRQLASTDFLTQLYNRMQFDEYLSLEIEKSKRYGGTFSLIYFDVDDFKEINDSYGHQFGDKILTDIAEHVSSVKRKSDILARYGGDEFIILAPSSDVDSAEQQAEIIQQSLRALTIKSAKQLSCSFGVVEFNNMFDSATNLINAVDGALYKAKRLGKNQVSRVDFSSQSFH